MSPFLFLLFLLPLGCTPFGLGGSSSSPLYTPSDPGITLLNATNLASTIHPSETAWLVEFYSSWCGHCIHFAPKFKELAKDVKGEKEAMFALNQKAISFNKGNQFIFLGWHRVVRVGALDCADEANSATCREYEVMGYPTLKFMPPGGAEKEVGEELLKA